jgi:hypothetical protein
MPGHSSSELKLTVDGRQCVVDRWPRVFDVKDSGQWSAVWVCAVVGSFLVPCLVCVGMVIGPFIHVR